MKKFFEVIGVILTIAFIFAFMCGTIWFFEAAFTAQKERITEKSKYKQITVYSPQTGKIIYEGAGCDISYYTFGTGIKFTDTNLRRVEIAGNAIVN